MYIFKAIVASLADAWIETRQVIEDYIQRNVASLADAWIETKTQNKGRQQAKVASLADAWIETLPPDASSPVPGSRVPRGRVD